MPASLRAHSSRAKSTRPYDRRSSSAGPAQSEITNLSRSAPPASPTQDPDDDEPDADVPPDLPGLPTYAQYKCLETAYLQSLSPRKRDKALITQAMFDKIWDVLHQPDACTIDTPQFRFWVRKMFTLSRDVGGTGADGGASWNGTKNGETGTALDPLPDVGSDADEAELELERSLGRGIGRATADELGFTAVVLHENRPVAIMEQLYELFCYCHVRAGHGGRDKTCAVIREHYSWVPKELTAQFVKACPTCVLKRNGQGIGVFGVGLGVVAHRRVSGGRRRRGHAIPSEVETQEETPAPAETSDLGWPTTGGPLDPANPEPCGVRERERERVWLRAHGNVGTDCPSSPVSPALGSSSRMHPVLSEGPPEGCPVGGWCIVPRTLTPGASPFFPCNPTCSPGHPQYIREEKENRSPARTELPSFASAQSSGSLDDHVSLAERAPAGDTAEYLLPSALRPLRLLGPVQSDAQPDLAGPSSYPFQIDPLLLSFDYPGLDHSPFMFHVGDDAASLDPSAGTVSSEAHDIAVLPSHGFYPLRTPSDDCVNLPALEPSRELDSPDSSFEQTIACAGVDGAPATVLPFSLSTEFMARSRCEPRYGYHDMLYPCAGDELGQEFDGPLSFSIMTDA